MPSPTQLIGANVTDNFQPVPLATRTFGQPRFHAEGEVASLVFAPDGSLYSVDDTGVLAHWSPEGKLLQRTFLSDLETLWCFSPRGDLLASGNDDLLLWDPQDGQLLGRLVQPCWVTAVAYHPDGTALATGHDDGTVRFWNPQAQRLTGEISAHPQAISALVFRPDGEQFATAGEDRIIRIWNAATHALIAELASHTDRIPALAWSPDGRLLVSAGWDTSARVWQPATSKDPLMLLNSHAEQVLLAAFSPSGAVLATADSDHDIHLWSNPVSGKPGKVLRGHPAEIRALAFNAEGTRLASAGADRVIHIWDVPSGQLIAGPNPRSKHAIAVLPGAKPQLASTAASDLRIWDIATGEEDAGAGYGSANAIAASPDGRWLAVGGDGIITKLYDRTQPNLPAKSLEATKPPIGALAISDDGLTLAQTSPTDGLVWLWNTQTGEPDLILIEAADGCTLECVAIHPDGIRVACGGADYLSTGDRDGAVCVWNRLSKEKELIFDTGVFAVAFDPKGRFLAGAGLDARVHMWELATEQEVFVLEGHTEQINAVAFSPDGSYLVTGGDDLTLRVWDVLSGRLIVVREFDSPIQALLFSPDGQHLFTGNGNTTCHQIEFQKILED
jgi:WD40 repeat protein